MSEQLEDNMLMKQIAQDNELAFKRIYDKYWKKLANTAFHFLKDKELAEGIVQDIFLELWSKRKNRDIINVHPYLKSAVKYKVLKEIQKRKIPVTQLDFIDEIKSLNTTEELLFMGEIENLLNQAAEKLPPKCKRIFLMSRFEYKSNKEIALELGVSVRTVENHIGNALRILKPILRYNIILLWLTY